MRYNPILSIILGAFVIIVSLLTLIGIVGSPNLNNKIIGGIFFIFATSMLLLGGFIATYFAREYENKIWYGYKIRYAIYLGIILAFLETIGEISRNLSGYQGIGIAILFFVLFPLITGVGGFIAKMTNKNNRQSFKSKHLTNGFSPIIAIAVGFIIATICANLLDLISGINSAATTFGVIDFVIGSISLLIGGFVTLFLVKEKKIQYGFYVAIIAIIISILKLYIDILQGIAIHRSYVVIFGAFIGYLLFVGIGSYIGIMVAKHLNNRNLD